MPAETEWYMNLLKIVIKRMIRLLCWCTDEIGNLQWIASSGLYL